MRRGVLVVEDNELVRDMCSTVLLESGRTVVATGAVDDALRVLAADHEIDVVVTDLSLPGGLSGIELVRTVRERHPGLGIVVTTGRLDDPSTVDSSIEVVMKPFGIDQLLAAVARAEAASDRARLTAHD